jgi:hypothetical protein
VVIYEAKCCRQGRPNAVMGSGPLSGY